jgi:hypothetical protein
LLRRLQTAQIWAGLEQRHLMVRPCKQQGRGHARGAPAENHDGAAGRLGGPVQVGPAVACGPNGRVLSGSKGLAGEWHAHYAPQLRHAKTDTPSRPGCRTKGCPMTRWLLYGAYGDTGEQLARLTMEHGDSLGCQQPGKKRPKGEA